MIPSVKSGLSYNGKLYAVPFYAESSFTFYRKDLFDQAGLKMPDKPTYDQIAEFAAKLTDKSKEQYGFCQRGKPGWGENMAFVGPMVNAFGGRWFNEKWEPQLTSEPWKKAVAYYVKNMNAYGPPGATANGHNENRALFATGHCAMWVDATSAAGYIYNPKESQVADKTAFAAAPVQVTSNGSGWFWAWALGIPGSSKKAEAAKSFVKWATSKDYIKMVGQEVGWVSAPPGNAQIDLRQSRLPEGRALRESGLRGGVQRRHHQADQGPCALYRHPVRRDPEFQGIGTAVGQQIAAALAGQVDSRPGARNRAAIDRADDETGRVSEVRRPAQPAGGRLPAGRLTPAAGQREMASNPTIMRLNRTPLQPAAAGGRSQRNVNTTPLIAPSVIILFLWMIVPLAMTLWFSFQYYNLLDPAIERLRRLRKLHLPADRSVAVDGDGQHPLPGLLGAGDHGRARHAARSPFRPGLLWPRHRATARDSAVFRHADGQRAHLEKHADASGQRAVRVLRALPGPARRSTSSAACRSHR